jgi:hypothetical protein
VLRWGWGNNSPEILIFFLYYNSFGGKEKAEALKIKQDATELNATS